jgi:UDP-glucose 4-epimerase
MNIMVLGSNGFIGQNFVNSLKSNPHKGTIHQIIEVPDVDTFLESKEMQKSHSVIVDCVGIKPFFYKSITNEEDFELMYSTLISRYNRLLDLSYSKNIRFVFISSGGAVYGRYLGNPWKEVDSVRPITQYGQVCRDVENLVLNADGMVIRGSNVYGALKSNKQGQGIVTEILLSYLNNKRIKLFNSGNTIRDFLHIRDFIQSLQKILHNLQNCSGILNLGSGEGHSQLNLVNIIDVILRDNKLPIFSPRVEVCTDSTDPIEINILSPKLYESTFGSIKNIKIEDGIKILMRDLAIIT